MMLTKENKEELREIIPKIDYTPALLPEATKDMVVKAGEEAVRYGFATLDVYPTWVKLASELVKGTGVGVLVTIGFPHGSTVTEAKVAETEQVLKDGATEIDMVINIARMLEGDYDYVRNDIKAVVDCAKKYGRGVKAILEVGYLTDEQKCTAARLAREAGAEYVKTCTGFGPGKACLHDILLLKETVGDKMKVKASGGVASLEDQLMFIRNGADRVAGRGNILEQLESIGVYSSKDI